MKGKYSSKKPAAAHPQSELRAQKPEAPVRKPEPMGTSDSPQQTQLTAPRRLSHRRLLLIITYAIVLYSALQNIGDVKGFIHSMTVVMQPVLVGLAMAFVLNVLLNFLEKTIFRPFDTKALYVARKLKRPLAVLLTLVIALGMVTMVALVVSPLLTESINLVINAIAQLADEEMSEKLTELLSQTPLPASAIEEIIEKVKTLTDQLVKFVRTEYAAVASTALNVTSTLLSFVIDLLLSTIIAIYVLIQKERIAHMTTNALTAYAPPKVRDTVLEVSRLSYSAFANFVRGQLAEAVILGGLCYIGMLIFRFPNAPVVSLLIGVSALVPILGAWIGGGVSAVLILIVDPMKALYFIIFLLVLQQLEGNLIYPRVVGNAIGLPGLLVLCAVVVGGNLGGVLGMLLGVPTVAIGYTLLKRGISSRLSQQNASSQDKFRENT